jgi:hypothetical protein
MSLMKPHALVRSTDVVLVRSQKEVFDLTLE